MNERPATLIAAAILPALTANYDNTISAFDLRHCNASDLAGTAYVSNGDNTLSMIPLGTYTEPIAATP
jgi:hypothetical protein